MATPTTMKGATIALHPVVRAVRSPEKAKATRVRTFAMVKTTAKVAAERLDRHLSGLEHEHKRWSVGRQRRRESTRDDTRHQLGPVTGMHQPEIGRQKDGRQNDRCPQHCLENLFVHRREYQEADRNTDDGPGQQTENRRLVGSPTVDNGLQTTRQESQPGRHHDCLMGGQSEGHQGNSEEGEAESSGVLRSGGHQDADAGNDQIRPSHPRTLPFPEGRSGDFVRRAGIDKL